MTETVMKLDSISDITTFLYFANKCPGEVTVYSGKYVVNGKSLLGLYSLDLNSHPIKVEITGDIPDDVKENLKQFVVG